MRLDEWLDAERGRTMKLARDIGRPPAMVSQWKLGLRPVSPKDAIAIERATNGEVTRADCRPDDWRLIWPEFAKEAA